MANNIDIRNFVNINIITSNIKIYKDPEAKPKAICSETTFVSNELICGNE